MLAQAPPRRRPRAAAAAALAACILWAPCPARAALPLPEDALSRLEAADLFQPGEPAILYADDGEPFAVLGDFRIFLPLARIPKVLRDAVVAVEDARFFQHGAVDLQGMARAALRNLTAGRITEGGSTITQQLAKTLFLTNERTLSRKMKEVQLARELERRYSKEKILEMYLNAVYFGDGAYGVEAAARTFFGKGVADLTLAEAALLAGLPKAPSRSSPITYPQRAKARRDHVLARMVEAKMLSPARARAAQREPVRTKPFFAARGIAPYFADYVQKQLEAELGPAAVARGGLRVSTTLNLRLQRAATEALREGIRAFQTPGAGGAGGARGKGAKAAAGAQRAGGAGLEGALIALDPRGGEIQAMVGGLDYGRSQFNRAVQSRRQPGSAFKPFVYAAAIEAGLPLTTLLDDVPMTYPAGWGRGSGTWSPENYDRRFRGRVTMREALEESINVPTVRLLDMVGVDPVLDVAGRMGLTGPLRRDLTLALGTSEVTLLELASAYGVIANRGLRVPPTAVRQVVGAGGDVRLDRRPEAQRVLSEEVAFLLTSLLQGVIERGTGRRAQALGRPAAGKTGTTQDATDLWFVGFTPSLVGGVWVGYDTPRSIGSHETGGRVAVPIWTDFMRRALRGTEPIPFQQPDGVYAAVVNPRTGEAVPPGEPDGLTEFFLRGRGPVPVSSGAPRPAPVSSPAVPAPAGAANDVIPPWGAGAHP
ncbi:MAG TPA: penicillin-binding protein 1A [Candidatus Sulfotelmatobacter sp.]|nr:penicillin-binding protein 1A [Candidatus Sulfotelmatobacter sp.]